MITNPHQHPHYYSKLVSPSILNTTIAPPDVDDAEDPPTTGLGQDMSVMLPCSLSLMIKIKDHLNSHLGMVYYINPGHISNHGFNPSHISILAIAIAGVFLTVFYCCCCHQLECW